MAEKAAQDSVQAGRGKCGECTVNSSSLHFAALDLPHESTPNISRSEKPGTASTRTAVPIHSLLNYVHGRTLIVAYTRFSSSRPHNADCNDDDYAANALECGGRNSPVQEFNVRYLQ
jgi:hypothetical protein